MDFAYTELINRVNNRFRRETEFARIKSRLIEKIKV